MEKEQTAVEWFAEQLGITSGTMLERAKQMEREQAGVGELNGIRLERVEGSHLCKYSVIENKLATLYQNQERILEAIKSLANGKTDH